MELSKLNNQIENFKNILKNLQSIPVKNNTELGQLIIKFYEIVNNVEEDLQKTNKAIENIKSLREDVLNNVNKSSVEIVNIIKQAKQIVKRSENRVNALK